MSKRVKINISWSNGVWIVSFGKNLFLETTDYTKAYFWKKYQNDIDKDFILDYIDNK
jgi:hypothetical protein